MWRSDAEDELSKYCYRCAQIVEKLNARLGADVVEDIVDLARAIAEGAAEKEVKDHEESNEHTHKSPW